MQSLQCIEDHQIRNLVHQKLFSDQWNLQLVWTIFHFVKRCPVDMFSPHEQHSVFEINQIVIGDNLPFGNVEHRKCSSQNVLLYICLKRRQSVWDTPKGNRWDKQTNAY